MCKVSPVTTENSFVEYVWKVARYTSSAPVYFEPCESDKHVFVDGGVKANNPTDYAFTRIQKHLDEQLDAMGQQVCGNVVEVIFIVYMYRKRGNLIGVK